MLWRDGSITVEALQEVTAKTRKKLKYAERVNEKTQTSSTSYAGFSFVNWKDDSKWFMTHISSSCTSDDIDAIIKLAMPYMKRSVPQPPVNDLPSEMADELKKFVPKEAFSDDEEEEVPIHVPSKPSSRHDRFPVSHHMFKSPMLPPASMPRASSMAPHSHPAVPTLVSRPPSAAPASRSVSHGTPALVSRPPSAAPASRPVSRGTPAPHGLAEAPASHAVTMTSFSHTIAAAPTSHAVADSSGPTRHAVTEASTRSVPTHPSIRDGNRTNSRAMDVARHPRAATVDLQMGYPYDEYNDEPYQSMHYLPHNSYQGPARQEQHIHHRGPPQVHFETYATQDGSTARRRRHYDESFHIQEPGSSRHRLHDEAFEIQEPHPSRHSRQPRDGSFGIQESDPSLRPHFDN